jgi:hypothetical protein
MARTWSECVSSSRKALARQDIAQHQIGLDAAEAIPPVQQGVDDDTEEKLTRYAEEIGVSYKTLERWRSVAIFFSGVMPQFPPTGGFRSVRYSAYRELQDRYGDDPEKAFAILRGAVESGPPPGTSDRWTWKAILDRIEAADSDGQGQKIPGGDGGDLSKTLAGQVAKAKTGGRKAAIGTSGTTPSAKGSVTTAAEGDSETPEGRIHRHLQGAWNVIPELDRELFADRLDDLRLHVAGALELVRDALDEQAADAAARQTDAVEAAVVA